MTQLPAATGTGRLLGPRDPAPFEIVNARSANPVVLVCEHAGRAVPQVLGDLGVPESEFDRHIAYDVGAEPVAREIAGLLDAPLVVQPYSRLVVDCNRPLESPDCMPEISDGTPVPANQGLDAATRSQRFEEIHVPFHGAVSELLDTRNPRSAAVLIAIHSFTPRLRTADADRPWELGFLFNRDKRFAERLMAASKARRPGLVAAYNEPYTVSDAKDYAMPVHGERRGIRHVLVEIRSDLIETPAGQSQWAQFLASAIGEAASEVEN